MSDLTRAEVESWQNVSGSFHWRLTEERYYRLKDSWLTLEARVREVIKERDEADRQAGELLRKNETLQEESRAGQRWLDNAKDQWGVDHNTSFDVIGDECLDFKAELQAIKDSRKALLEYWDRNFPLNIQVVDKLEYYVEQLRVAEKIIG